MLQAGKRWHACQTGRQAFAELRSGTRHQLRLLLHQAQPWLSCPSCLSWAAPLPWLCRPAASVLLPAAGARLCQRDPPLPPPSARLAAQPLPGRDAPAAACSRVSSWAACSAASAQTLKSCRGRTNETTKMRSSNEAFEAEGWSRLLMVEFSFQTGSSRLCSSAKEECGLHESGSINMTVCLNTICE